MEKLVLDRIYRDDGPAVSANRLGSWIFPRVRMLRKHIRAEQVNQRTVAGTGGARSLSNPEVVEHGLTGHRLMDGLNFWLDRPLYLCKRRVKRQRIPFRHCLTLHQCGDRIDVLADDLAPDLQCLNERRA